MDTGGADRLDVSLIVFFDKPSIQPGCYRNGAEYSLQVLQSEDGVLKYLGLGLRNPLAVRHPVESPDSYASILLHADTNKTKDCRCCANQAPSKPNRTTSSLNGNQAKERTTDQANK